jgi:hypothetical protein
MLPTQLTKLLICILLAAGLAQLLAWSRLQHAIDDAASRAQDLADVRADVNDLKTWNIATPPPTSPASPTETATASHPDDELNRRLSQAAQAARMTDQIAGIEPGPSIRLNDGDFTETPVYVRLSNVTLRELVTFLYQLSSTDRALRSKMIELSAPELGTGAPPAQGHVEIWTADLTLNNLTFSPKSRDDR